MRQSILSRVVLCLLIATLPLTVRAGSFQLSEQSVSGLGTAFAGGAASAEDASTLFYNPAGLARLDQGELQMGLHLIMPSAEFRNEGTRYNLPGTPFNGLGVVGGNGGDAGVNHIIGNLYLSQPVFRNTSYGDLTVGVGMTTPFGLETDYSPDWVGRYAALRTKLTTIDLQPTVAWRYDRFSIGAGLDIQYASARLTQAIDFGLAAQAPLAQFYAALPAILAARGVPPAAIAPTIAATRAAYTAAGFVPGGRDGVTEISGDDLNLGFTVGALFEYRKAGEGEDAFLQDGRIGFSYRSKIDHTIEGDAEFRRVPLITAAGAPVQFPSPTAFQAVFFDQGATAEVALPDIMHFSIYQRFARRFAVMGDVTWTHWSRLQQVPIVFENAGTPATILNIGYDDARRYALGFEWYACKSLTLRTGFAYDETPIPNPDLRTPRVPDNNRYWLSFGAKYSPKDWLDLDIGYAHLFVDDPFTTFTDSQGHQLIGTYDAHVDIVSASVTIKWGGPREKTTTYAKDSKSVYRK
ncbi:MAG: long-chain fatty acid transport protein [Verrucomicrobiota bacterium]